jgi:hypothetical protein
MGRVDSCLRELRGSFGQAHFESQAGSLHTWGASQHGRSVGSALCLGSNSGSAIFTHAPGQAT